MWGKEMISETLKSQIRFNPTHVGKSRFFRKKCLVSPVQPHACGEKDRLE